MSLPPDARERAALCQLLDDLGPGAPTLCGDWTTQDLAAHLVARERSPLAAPGIVLGGRFERLTERVMADVATLGYPTVVELIRSGPPLIPWGLPVLRELLNLNEYFVHHEDVRRANDLEPRVDPALDDALRPAVSRMAAVQLWRGGVDVVLRDERGEVLARRGREPAEVIGRPGELLLWLNGRGVHADVSFAGDEDRVAALWAARLAI